VAQKGVGRQRHLIASRHRAKLVLEYLRAGGVAEEKIATVYAPAGLHLGASTPEEIALSVMSQMVALRRGGDVSQIPLEEGSLPGHSFDVDAVIRRCEAETLP
jgi:xanthine/CO dehydrogenase XdhC/CoxF family maturation factor